ncbi:MAG: histidine phosphatase family protein [Fibrobacter sp.]|uniref:histidine phosphatase family protein n=1 Tax=Fibrobacter sp. TaxID=35828 RepID=UPI0025BE7D6F|nr:histidine phosphatase family protein [Fibrobacter sp.]MBR4785274.1 histidine phosphatase family protein [Fibrobacter sp.]
MKKSFLKIIPGFAVAAAILLSACDSGESNGLSPVTPDSSADNQTLSSAVPTSSAVAPTSSEVAPVSQTIESSSSVALPPESSATVPGSSVSGVGYQAGTLEEEMAKDAPFVAASAANAELIPVADLLASLQPTERVIFVLRHARRGSGTGRETPLHNTGVNQAQALGAAIAAVNATDPIFYAHSDYVRTQQTAQNIFVGRGGDASLFTSTIVPKLAGGGYVKDSDLLAAHAEEDFETNQIQTFANWMYNGVYLDAFNDIKETSVAFLTQHILPAFPPEYRIGIMISHDMTVAPLVAYCTNFAVDFKAYESLKKWCGFVQGLAIVISEDGSRRYVPVNGLYGQYAYLDGNS